MANHPICKDCDGPPQGEGNRVFYDCQPEWMFCPFCGKALIWDGHNKKEDSTAVPQYCKKCNIDMRGVQFSYFQRGQLLGPFCVDCYQDVVER